MLDGRRYSTSGTKAFFLRLGEQCKQEAAMPADHPSEGKQAICDLDPCSRHGWHGPCLCMMRRLGMTVSMSLITDLDYSDGTHDMHPTRQPGESQGMHYIMAGTKDTDPEERSLHIVGRWRGALQGAWSKLILLRCSAGASCKRQKMSCAESEHNSASAAEARAPAAFSAFLGSKVCTMTFHSFS